MPEGTVIREGMTDLFVPLQHSSGGPGKILNCVFFNEQMAFNRDVSVMVLRSLDKEMKVADCMTATGSRAVRIANEAPKTEVVANDINSGAIPFIEENIRINNLTNCRPSRRNLHALLAEEVFDYVDLDPFGSPVPFMHSAIQGCRRGGILAITATDTAPLAGAHRAKCERRYDARPMRGAMCHEVGLRILMGSVAKDLAKFDRGMVPLLSFYADHYFRFYIKITEGANAADKTLENMIAMSYDPVTLERSFSHIKEGSYKYGPMWGGNLFDKEFVSKLSSEGMADQKRCSKFLSLWNEELDTTPFLYDMSEVASALKVSTPKFEVLLEALNENGKTTKTHMSPTSFKTELSPEEVKSVFREVASHY